MTGVAVETAGATVVSPTSPSDGRPTYLKSYPYLFVRETDQTDYFCTVCEQSLTEDQLQSHLFDTHSAENLQDYFVRVLTGGSKYLYICVVCWAKLSSKQEMQTHRETCKVSFGDESPDNTMDGIEPDNVVSTPDIPSMMDDDDGIDHRNGVQTNGSSRAASPSFPQPEVILDTDLPATTVTSGDSKQQLNYSSQCMQCSLCTMILPSSTYLSHLKTYHRVTCPLTSANCPLCMSCVPIMDLTVHLASQHGLVPQSAVNALLLWVLTSNTFALNDTAQASLKSKFRGDQQQQVAAMMTSTPKSSQGRSGQQSVSSQSSTSRVKQTASKAQAAPANKVKQEAGGALINDMRGKLPIEQVITSFTRSHTGPGGKESHQCLVCSKWYAIPPIKHMRSHIAQFEKENRKICQLASGASVCLICYKVCESQAAAKACVASHSPDGLPGGASGGLLAEALMGISSYKRQDQSHDNSDDLPLGATFETPGLKPSSPAPSQASTNTGEMMNVELDNAGRVKSGKVRKQCELCGEWSNIKWFFKHMSEVHNALFCRCCREYLPIHEHKEHRHWHQMPPYMGQKIRIEDGQPIIIDRKERASLTPIGSLAAWGGSSGGLVVKAVDEVVNRKRKAEKMVNSPSSVKTSSSSNVDMGGYQLGMLPPDLPAIPTLEDDPGRDSLMPKERCPVCAIEITHKNLARHIKLRHGIRYKFCYKCRKLVPGHLYAEHKNLHEQGQIETVTVGLGDKQLEYLESCKTDDEDDAIEIPEEMLDQALDSNGSRKKDETFRANTSMTKLESLMGKEFKHPRRKCSICGYSVSYSNFKRHLRNAHPGELGEESGQDVVGDMEMMGHHMDDTDRMSYNTVAGLVEEKGSEKAEDLESILRLAPGDENWSPGVTKGSSPRPRPIIMRACPECGVEMRSDSITKHCKIKHKVSYRYCSACAKYVLKKNYKSHMKTCDSCELKGNISNNEKLDGEWEGETEEIDLDTSKEEEDDEMIIDDEGMEEVEEPEAKKTPSKIYNCFDCNRMFMSAEAHANHIRDIHGGEGGSVVLKLPLDKTIENMGEERDDYEEKAEDELVIDDSQ